jgi:hypothetical protein
MGDYYIRRNEIFARAFESYINLVLSEKGWENKFLQRNNQSRAKVYLSALETANIRNEMETLISCVKKYL